MRKPPFVDRRVNGKTLIAREHTWLLAFPLLLFSWLVLARRNITELLGGFIDRQYTANGQSYFEVGVAFDHWERAVLSKSTVIVTVHGTGDESHESRFNPLRPRWWQDGSSFSAELFGEILEKDAAWLPFHWHGANSDAKRHEGARGLAQLCGALAERKVSYVLLGHSHGGNVSERALTTYASSTGNISYCKSVVTLGAPFFKSRPKLGHYLQLISKFLGAPFAVMGAAFILYNIVISIDSGKYSLNNLMYFPIFSDFFLYTTMFVVLSSIAASLMKGNYEGVNPIFSLNLRRSILSSAWVSLVYVRDEVINLLPLAASRKLNFVAVAAEKENFKRIGLALGRFVNIAIIVIGVILVSPAITGNIQATKDASGIVLVADTSLQNVQTKIKILAEDRHANAKKLEKLTAKSKIYSEAASNSRLHLKSQRDKLRLSLFLFPAIVLVVSYLMSIVMSFLLNPVFSTLASSLVAFCKNSFLRETIRGIAFGDDFDFELTGTSAQPNFARVAPRAVSTDYAEKISQDNYAATVQALYSSITNSASENFTFLETGEIVANLMRSIYHNAYFQDAQIIKDVASHIRQSLYGPKILNETH